MLKFSNLSSIILTHKWVNLHPWVSTLGTVPLVPSFATPSYRCSFATSSYRCSFTAVPCYSTASLVIRGSFWTTTAARGLFRYTVENKKVLHILSIVCMQSWHGIDLRKGQHVIGRVLMCNLKGAAYKGIEYTSIGAAFMSGCQGKHMVAMVTCSICVA